MILGNNCPHCGTILEPPPKRKKQCSVCGKHIFVRTDPFDKEKVYYVNECDGNLLYAIRALPVTEKMFRDAIAKAKNWQTVADTIWGLMSLEKQKAAKKGDWSTISDISWHQAWYLLKTGRNYMPVLQEHVRAMLQRDLAQGNWPYVRVMSSRDNRTCEVCRSLDGKVFTVEEALTIMPLPVKCDTGEMCRCVYTYQHQR